MTTIVHRTPGLLDTRSFTVMGMSAKPTTNAPIGQFGTGLKYSIAGLLRSGASVDIWVGREHWQFGTESEEFRGASFTRIHAYVRKWGGLRRRRVDLPFTTQLGPHWVPWMWMRELHSNTLDENGETLVGYLDSGTDGLALVCAETTPSGRIDVNDIVQPTDNTTLIVVTHPEYAAAWQDRESVFHPTALGPSGAASGAVLEAIPSAPHGRVYYRGLRVLDLRLPSVTCTWNILAETPLTEDRTMHEFYARSAIARWLVRDCEDEDLIATVISADEDHWEHGMEFPHHIRPSDAFERAARTVRRMSGRLSGYMGAWAPPAPLDTRPFFERRGRRWQLAEDRVLDERGRELLNKPDDLTDEDWREVAGALVSAVAVDPPPTPPRPMVAMDIYAGLGRHEWHYDYESDPVRIECSVCGALHSEEADNYWGECEPPEWMTKISLYNSDEER
jgi:hypothetical protein